MIELFGYQPTYPERIATFERELVLIQHPELRKFAAYCLDQAPAYFFHVPASTSGKYHPRYALGEGGLVRHTKAAIGIAHYLSNTDILRYYGDFDPLVPSRADLLLISLLLHDTYKCGDEDNAIHTVFEHPAIAARKVMSLWFDYSGGERPPQYIDTISRAIHSHMGQWNNSRKSSELLPTPLDFGYDNWLCKLVHICDFLASRKCLEYNFDEHLR